MFSTILTNIARKLIPATNQITIEDIYPCLVKQRERNEKRMAQIIEEMQELWILHPKHKAKKLKVRRPV